MGRNSFRILDLRKAKSALSAFTLSDSDRGVFVFKSSSVSLPLFRDWGAKYITKKESAKKEDIPITFGRFGIVREPL